MEDNKLSVYHKLWWTLIVIVGITFFILAYYGREVYRQAPPIPSIVKTQDGSFSFTKDDILEGQSAWQSIGGMQLGSIWGHGSYQAPDWSADWLHRELVAWMNLASKDEYAKAYDEISDEQKNIIKYRLKTEYRRNTYDVDKDEVIISQRRAEAIKEVMSYYDGLFSNDEFFRQKRQNFAMKENTLPDKLRRGQLSKFFFWTSWSASTERPNTHTTYTNNWPHEPLIDNKPTPENIIWSIVSVVLLIASIGGLIWVWAFFRDKDEEDIKIPLKDPISLVPLTESQIALGKYIFLVAALFVFQVFMGAATAHYTVEGQHFYGIELSKWFPYTLTRTWHLQSALFWIATGFLLTGLFLAPIINGGKDPQYQKLGVNLLFWALVIVVVGSFFGNYLAIMQSIKPELNFWFGHQGYEYLDLGRFWQIGKFLGIAFWLFLMLRGIVPALKQKGDKNILSLLTASVIAIGLFYGAGFFYGEKSHLSVMEYWRWWVVHLWVEGFFEVFATTALAFIFCTMGLVSRRGATVVSLASASLFLLGGIPGTFHHLYFSGTTTPVMAVGATFSALEVVPLIVLGYEAWENWRLKEKAPWMEKVRWPLVFFITVAFWNMIGAGVFGFMINPPIALFYVQGLNTTAVHAHAALFGVYGFFALGLSMLTLRYIRPDMIFCEKLMKTSYYCLNGGLILMLVTSLIPIGFMQFFASLSEGFWYARGEEFMQQDIIVRLRWFRTIGDVVFMVGTIAWALQIIIGLFGAKNWFKKR